MYPSQSDTSNDKTIIRLFEVGGIENKNTVEGPVGNTDEDNSNDDSKSDSTREVALSGSTISVETGGAGAFGVDNLPVDRVDISNVSDGGGIPGPNPDGLAWSSAVGLPDTVSFKLTPGSSYEAGDTITFTADGTQITLEIVEVSTPAEISDEVSSEQYKTVAGNDGEVTQSEMISSFNDWFNSEDGSIGDTEFKQRDTTQLFNYWFNKGS
jgi:hypothetical protein